MTNGGAGRRSDSLWDVVRTLGFVAVFTSLPLFAALQNIQPPWPEPADTVAYISAAIVLMGALVARGLGADVTRRTRVKLLVLAAVLTVVGLFTYLYLYSTLVVTLEDGGRLIRGFVCNDRGLELFRARCPHLTELDLAGDEYKPENLFTPASITWAQLSLLGAWLLFTAGLVAAVAWAVATRGEAPGPQDQKRDPRDNGHPSAQSGTPEKRNEKSEAGEEKLEAHDEEPEDPIPPETATP